MRPQPGAGRLKRAPPLGAHEWQIAPARSRLRLTRAAQIGTGPTSRGRAGQMPEWRLKICSIFWDSAERAITMSQPASCAWIFSSP